MCFQGKREGLNTTLIFSVFTFNIKCVGGSQNMNTEEGKNVKRGTEEHTQNVNTEEGKNIKRETEEDTKCEH